MKFFSVLSFQFLKDLQTLGLKYILLHVNILKNVGFIFWKKKKLALDCYSVGVRLTHLGRVALIL